MNTLSTPKVSREDRRPPGGTAHLAVLCVMVSLVCGVALPIAHVKLLSAAELRRVPSLANAAWAGPVATRLPAALFVALIFAVLWTLLRTRTTPICVAAACLAFAATPAFDYAYDVRSIIGSPSGLAWCLVGSAVAAAMSLLLSRIESRRLAVAVIVTLSLTFVARQARCGYQLLHQRHAFFRFRDAVERAAAPGEPVIVADALAAGPLYWYGSAALREELVAPAGSAACLSAVQVRSATLRFLLAERQEMVFVGPPDSPVANELRAAGYALQEQTGQVPWPRLKGVTTPLLQADSRIFLAIPAALP